MKKSSWKLWTLNYELLMSVMAEAEPDVRAQGLEMKEFFMLSHLDAHPNPAELARATLTPKPTVTFMIKRMEAASFVLRENEPSDLRRFRLTLTPSGRQAMEAATAALDEAFGKRLARLTSAQRTELLRMYERMTGV